MKRSAPLIVMLVVVCASAQAKDLLGVFEDAVRNDPVIRQADANRLAAREARPQAWAALLPQLNGTAGVTGDHNSGSQPLETANPNNPNQAIVVPVQAVADTTTRQWAVNLRQNVFSWANWMTLKAAGSQVAQAEADYQAAEQQLILRVAQAYFTVLSAYDNLQANQASLEAIARQLDQAEQRFSVGLIAITDVQEARAARDTAAAAVIAGKRSLATAEDQLQEITGQKYEQLAKPGGDMPLQSPQPADESRWVELSLDQNLTLISSRLGADIARDNVRVAEGGHLPTLDLLAGRSYQNQGVNQIYDGLPFN
jgi:outer membrane protein